MNISAYVSRKGMEKCILHKWLNNQLGNEKLRTVLRNFIMNPELLAIPDLVNEHIVLKSLNFGFHGHEIFG
ncbi:hypothetical protein D3C77_603920 [compost metagenome]